MSRKAKVVSFLLVLVATLTLVYVLSAMTQDSPQAAADRYIEQLHVQQRQAQEFSAPAGGQKGIPLFASLAGVLCILAIPVTGWLVLAKSRRKSQRVQERRRARREQRAGGLDLRYRV